MADELPPLPKSLVMVAQFHGEWRETINPRAEPVYTADQMRAYAQEAARQERERLSFDVDLGRVAIQFVDRAGDVADCDPAERICAEFHKAACEVCDRHRSPATQGQRETP